MDELHRRRQLHMLDAAIAQQLGGGQRHHRAHALATGGDDMAGKLRDQRHRAGHALDDQPVHLLHIGGDEAAQPVERAAVRALAVL